MLKIHQNRGEISEGYPGWEWHSGLRIGRQGRIKASVGPGAVPNAVPLQTYNQLTTPTNYGPPKLRPGCCSTPSTPRNAAL